MEIIDEDGMLFGVVNVVDALVVLLVVAVVAAGVALVSAGGSEPTPDEPTAKTSTTVVTFRTSGHPAYVVEAIREGSPTADDVVAINGSKVIQRGPRRHTVLLNLALETTLGESGLPQFRGDRLVVGRGLTLDLTTVRVKGVVSELDPSSSSSTPTPEPVTQVIEFRAVVPSYVAAAIDTGPVSSNDIDAVRNVSVEHLPSNDGRAFERSLVRMEVELVAKIGRNGHRRFRNGRLYIGRELRLDLGDTIVRGNVTDFERSEG